MWLHTCYWGWGRAAWEVTWVSLSQSSERVSSGSDHRDSLISTAQGLSQATRTEWMGLAQWPTLSKSSVSDSSSYGWERTPGLSLFIGKIKIVVSVSLGPHEQIRGHNGKHLIYSLWQKQDAKYRFVVNNIFTWAPEKYHHLYFHM